MNPKAGCAGSVLNILEMDGFNHQSPGNQRCPGRRVQPDDEPVFPGTQGKEESNA